MFRSHGAEADKLGSYFADHKPLPQSKSTSRSNTAQAGLFYFGSEALSFIGGEVASARYASARAQAVDVPHAQTSYVRMIPMRTAGSTMTTDTVARSMGPSGINHRNRMNPTNVNKAEANRDPISGAPGAHPVGTGVGAAAGGIAGGAAAGTLAAGPVGTVIGAAVGAVLGGLGGKAIAEHYDPTVEEAHWRDNFEREPYYQRGMTYDDYAPAYRLGGESRSRTADQSFEDVEEQLAEQYGQVRGQSRLDWESARQATRAGWNRLDVAATRNN